MWWIHGGLLDHVADALLKVKESGSLRYLCIHKIVDCLEGMVSSSLMQGSQAQVS